MNRETLKLYWNELRHHKWLFFTALVAIPVGAVLTDSILPYILSLAIGELATGNSSQLHTYLWLAVTIGILCFVFNLIGFQALVRSEAAVVRRLRNHTFASILRKDNDFFSNQKVGSMTSRYIDFVRSFLHLQDLLIIRTLGFTLTLSTGLIILLIESWQVALAVLILIVLLMFQVRWSLKVRSPWRQERKKLVAEIHGEVADTFTNNTVVRSYASEDTEMSTLADKTSRFEAVFKKDIGFFAVEGSVRVLLMIIMQLVAISLSAMFIQNGTMPLATAIFILAYLQRVGSQIFMLSDILNGYDQAFLDAQPMTEMLLTNNAVVDPEQSLAFNDITPVITFDNVSYRYPDGNDTVISDISLSIPAGQKVGLVGHSGAGKSTIVSLLLRYADVTNGAITIDNKDLRDITQHDLRKHIAYVPQEPMLFHRSLRENIIYGKPSATDAEIHSAVQRANAAEFIDKLPHGLDTIVGERGVKLSGGQRQRIAIARAILKDAPILILDEATSALDSESEKLIQESLSDLMKNRTSIVIAHRLSTIAKLDRIIVLDNGSIIEDGSHTQLLAKNGIYASLWKHQSGGFIED